MILFLILYGCIMVASALAWPSAEDKEGRAAYNRQIIDRLLPDFENERLGILYAHYRREGGTWMPQRLAAELPDEYVVWRDTVIRRNGTDHTGVCPTCHGDGVVEVEAVA